MESQCKFYLSRKIDAVALRNLWFIYIFTSIYKFITKTALNNKVYCYGKKNLPRVPLYRSIVMGEKNYLPRASLYRSIVMGYPDNPLYQFIVY